MDSIKFINEKEAVKFIKSCDKSKLVFWVGAGIDSENPTGLPLGYGLSKFMLNAACKKYERKISYEWRKLYEALKINTKDSLEIAEYPRLETLIETIKVFEEHYLDKGHSVINGLKGFTSNNFKPNHNHYVLAYYLHLGATIITTNYGDFICKAYEELYGQNTIIHNKEQLHYYETTQPTKGKIYHIHGISEDIDTIGANLSNVKNKLPKSLTEKIEDRIKSSEGYYFIYLGYSGMDTLDVNPYLLSIETPVTATSSGIYIRHTNTKELSAPYEKEKILLFPFANKNICCCNTSDFLRNLKTYPQYDPYHEKKPKEAWNKIMESYINDFPEAMQDAFLLGLCYKLGLNQTIIMGRENWIQNIKREELDKWYLNYYLFQNARTADRKLLIIHYLKYNAKDFLMYIAFKVLKVPMNILKRVYPLEMIRQEIKTQIRGESYIEWTISNKLNCWISVILKIISNSHNIKNKISLFSSDNNILLLQNNFKNIIDAGYDKVVDVNQINTAYRGIAICYILFPDCDFERAFKCIEQALYNYTDVSSLDGIISTYVYGSIVYAIAAYRIGEEKYFKKANDYIDTATKLSQEFMHQRHNKKISMAQTIIKGLKKEGFSK
ncbi:SIR2 family protein [Gallibacter sp. Marseille-QA0791]|uniref:SIR2 family protein n=1 Tax=Gallibacter sp. Marseille-QA0791 TaxID=3378781 RepID=UPI003D10683C